MRRLNEYEDSLCRSKLINKDLIAKLDKTKKEISKKNKEIDYIKKINIELLGDLEKSKGNNFQSNQSNFVNA